MSTSTLAPPTHARMSVGALRAPSRWSGASAAPGGPACGILLPDPQCPRVLGVIEFFAGEPRRLDSEVLATMSALGDQIGQAVERRRDAEALGAKEARHRAMLDGALDCVVTMDHEGPCWTSTRPLSERSAIAPARR
jgi:hypothetical protein